MRSRWRFDEASRAAAQTLALIAVGGVLLVLVFGHCRLPAVQPDSAKPSRNSQAGLAGRREKF